MRILVTGASGLLGINLALEAAKDHTVFGVVNRRKLRLTGEPANEGLPFKPFTVIQADLLEPGVPERLLAETCPDWVIHCAALADVDQCENDPELARQLNTELPGKLAALCANSGDVARGGARFLHISTDAVFDGLRGGYAEGDAPNPLSVYARTKLASERAVLQANPQAAIARVNLFGWSLTGRRSLGEFFFYNLQAGRGVNGFTDVFFCPLLVNELAQVLLKMLAAGLSGLYHAVSGECLSKYEFGVRLARRFGLDETLISAASVAQGGLKAARSPNLTLRNDKLSRALGEPLPNVSTGLDGLYTLYQQGYPQFLKRLVSGEQ
jgi:dTDP-4-dehydrorhamnose reductase